MQVAMKTGLICLPLAAALVMGTLAAEPVTARTAHRPKRLASG